MQSANALAAIDTDVLIVGAGPTGLAAAIDARRHGLSVRVVEQRETRAEISKALVVHARTMEVLARLGAAEAVLLRGKKFRALHVHTALGRTTRVDLIDRRWGDTRFPFWLSLPQYDVERVLEEKAALEGAQVAWGTTLTALEQSPTGVTASLRLADGRSLQHRARFVLGCDGGRSTTRELIGVTLARRALGVDFALADVDVDSDLVEDEGHVVVGDEGALLIVPMPAPGRWRLIAQVRDDGELDAAAWNALVLRRAGLDLRVHSTGWRSRFSLSSGVSSSMRQGRVFLLGDAAHVHSPVGGQGLNTGVQDAHNLVWKLALVARGDVDDAAGEALLESYERERHSTAVSMVRATERATRLLTTRNPLARRVLRFMAPRALRLRRIGDLLGRGVGMLDLTTDGRPRLPNPELRPGLRLHDRVIPLRPLRLKWAGGDVVVRPDLVVARPKELPAFEELDLSSDAEASEAT